MVGAVGIELNVLPLAYDFPFLLFSALNLAHRAFVAFGALSIDNVDGQARSSAQHKG